MPTLSSNNVYLALDGVDVSGYWTGQINKSGTTATQDITAGAGATHVQRAPGLSDNNLSFAIVYDTADLATYRAKLVQASQYTVTYGPESNTAGKPKFECDMILTGVDGPNPTIDKTKVMFEVSFEAADAPTDTIEGGSTF